MKLENLKEQNFKCFDALTAKPLNEQIASVKYIEFLAGRMNTDISDWNINKLFKKPNSTKLIITDKSKINKKFFAEIEKKTKKTTGESNFLKVREKVEKAFKISKDRQTGIIREDLRYVRQQMKDYKKQIDNLIKRERDLKQSVESIRSGGDVDKMFNSISNALGNSFWKFHSMTEKNMVVVTNGNVIMSEKNPAQRIDRTVNLGKFKVTVNLNHLNVYVNKYQNNLDAGADDECEKDKYFHYHPYIDQDGDVCWGNVTQHINDFRREGNLEGILSMLASLLNTYSPTSMPFCSLNRFEMAQNKKLARKKPKKKVTKRR